MYIRRCRAELHLHSMSAIETRKPTTTTNHRPKRYTGICDPVNRKAIATNDMKRRNVICRFITPLHQPNPPVPELYQAQPTGGSWIWSSSSPSTLRSFSRCGCSTAAVPLDFSLSLTMPPDDDGVVSFIEPAIWKGEGGRKVESPSRAGQGNRRRRER